MDQLILDRVKLRRERLQECKEVAKTIIEKLGVAGSVEREEFIRAKLSLTQSIQSFKEETLFMLEKVSPETLQSVDVGLGIQLEAERVLVEMETITDAKERGPSSSGTCKLPKLELFKFDGNILQWTQFWDKFEANIDCTNLKEVEKLSYLLSSLEGDARAVIEGMSITNDNYAVAVETLKNRYGSKERVIDAHYEALSKLNLCNYNAGECRKTLDTLQQHLRILKSLGENSESNHLRSLIMSKFPERVLYDVNLLTSHDKTVTSVLRSLANVITAMEMSQPSSSTTSAKAQPLEEISTQALQVKSKFQRNKNKKFSQQTTPKFDKDKKRKSLDDLKHDNQPKDKRRRKPCIFCSGAHYNDECDVVKTFLERKEKLRNRCYNCFKMDHRLAHCPKPKHCHHCSGPHNSALCFKKLQNSNSTGSLQPPSAKLNKNQ